MGGVRLAARGGPVACNGLPRPGVAGARPGRGQ
jgi:hypothetical protein